MMRRNNLGKMKSEHIKNFAFKSEYTDLLVLYIPQTATSYHHSTSIQHVYLQVECNSSLFSVACFWVFFLFFFSLISSTENDYEEQNDDDVRCGSR